MTDLIRSAVQNLIGGVSQQPNSVRLENQAEEAENCFTHIVDGLGKRQPTQHIRKLEEIDILPEDALIHWIDRDSTERYAVIIDNDPVTPADRLQVFDAATGEQIPVYGDLAKNPVDSAVWDYIKSSEGTENPREDLKLLTIADTTFILNRHVTTAKDTTGDPTDSFDAAVSGTDIKSRSARRSFLFLRSANPSTKYAVRLHVKTGPNHPTDADTWDPPITDFGGESKEEWERRATSWVKTFDLDFTKHPTHNGLPYPRTIAGWGDLNSNPPYIPLEDGTDWDAAHLGEGHQIATVDSHEVLRQLWTELREGIPAHLTGTTTASMYPGGIQEVWFYERQLTANRHISDIFIGEWNGAGTFTVDPPLRDSVLMLGLVDLPHDNASFSEDMRLSVESQGVAEQLIAFSDEVPKLSQLPLTCWPGHVVKITGLEDVDGDEYYVEFVPHESETTGLHSGYWKESLASLSYPDIDANTMPMKLTRHPDGGGFMFVLEPASWASKTVGDDESNPDPSFIGQPIEDLFLWRNRLGFLTQSRFIMSEADEYENFWRTTVQSLLDSDPIDIDAGHRRVADLRYGVPLEEDLIVFSDRTQFLAQGDPLLTPRTASLAPVTEYESFPDIRPEVIGRGIFYGYHIGGGEYTQIDFYHRRGDVSESFDAFKSTAQIPRYLPGKLVEMTATTTESVLAVRTDDPDARNTIYIHKWLDRGADRILSSWMKYTVGAPGKCKIHGMKFIEDTLHLVIQREHTNAGRLYLEKIVFAGQRQLEELAGKPTTFRTMLDRRMSHVDIEAAAAAGSYTAYTWNAAFGTLDIQLPYHVSDDDAGPGGLRETKMVSGPGHFNGPAGEQILHTNTATNNTGTIVRVSDPTNALSALWAAGLFTFYFGESYTMRYQFSQPTLRESKRDGTLGDVQTGRYQLYRGTVSFEDTGYFRMIVAPIIHADGLAVIDRDSRTTHLPLLEVGLGHSKVSSVNIRDGRLQFGIYSKSDLVDITLENDSPYPCNPKSIEYEAIHSRYSRMSRL